MSHPRSLAVPQSAVEDSQEGRLQLVSPVRGEHLADLDSARSAPGFFQEIVEKSVELRVTVIDGHVFTAAVHSQLDERTRHD